jgi:hypothetical protein
MRNLTISSDTYLIGCNEMKLELAEKVIETVPFSLTEAWM